MNTLILNWIVRRMVRLVIVGCLLAGCAVSHRTGITDSPAVVQTVTPAPMPSTNLNIFFETTLRSGYTAWSPDGKWLALVTSSTIDLFETESFTLVRSLSFDTTSTGAWQQIEFSPHGRWLAAASPGLINVCDMNTGLWQYQLPDRIDTPTSLRFSPDDAILVATGISDQSVSGPGYPIEIQFWDMATGQQLVARHLGESAAWVSIVTYKADQTLLINYLYGDSYSRGFSGAVEKWSVSALMSGTENAEPLWRKDNITGPIRLVPGPEEQMLALLGSTSGSLVRWDRDGQATSLFEIEPVRELAMSPLAGLIASTSDKEGRGVIRLHEAQTGRLVNTLNPSDPMEYVAELEFSPDGRWLAAQLYVPETATNLWDVKTGQLLYTFDKEQLDSFSPDGRWLLTQTTNSNEENIIRVRMITP